MRKSFANKKLQVRLTKDFSMRPYITRGKQHRDMLIEWDFERKSDKSTNRPIAISEIVIVDSKINLKVRLTSCTGLAC